MAKPKVISIDGQDCVPVSSAPATGPESVVRCLAGVYVGVVESVSGNTAVIKNAKRCWKFYTGKGVGSCSELAVYGTVDSKSRITQPVAQITVFDVREIIPLAATATVNPTEAV
jgi:hypothetical protein